MVNKKRLVIAMTGATGAIYGVRMLQVLGDLPDWETHLVISAAGLVNLKYELDMDRSALTSVGMWGTAWAPSSSTNAPTACAFCTISPIGVMVPRVLLI